MYQKQKTKKNIYKSTKTQMGKVKMQDAKVGERGWVKLLQLYLPWYSG